jgi:hypothetical protein
VRSNLLLLLLSICVLANISRKYERISVVLPGGQVALVEKGEQDNHATTTRLNGGLAKKTPPNQQRDSNLTPEQYSAPSHSAVAFDARHSTVDGLNCRRRE